MSNVRGWWLRAGSLLCFALALALGGCDSGGSDGEGGTESSAVEGEEGETEGSSAGCLADPCDHHGANCGSVSDGCGGQVVCGDCAPGETCGAGGANQCGEGSCEPATCETAGAQCGSLSDGCAGVLDCGSCGDGGSCEDNVCVDSGCEPTSCDALGLDCGTAADGCGGTLDCGACPLCDLGCPAGFDCVEGDICSGGTAAELELDVQSFQVSGTLVTNGVAAQPSEECWDDDGWDDIGQVRLTEIEHGYTFTFPLHCNHSLGFPWALDVFPGTYRVEAGGSPTDTNLPGWNVVIYEELHVTEHVSKLELEVSSIPVSGTVLANGVPAMPSGECWDDDGWDDIGQVRFTEVEHGYVFTYSLHCSHANGFPWALEVFPGTYRVEAGGDSENTDLAGWNVVIYENFEVSEPEQDVALDVRSVKVAGKVFANGNLAAPSGDCYDDGGWQDIGHVRFTETTHGYTFTHAMHCDESAGFPWKLEVFPGTYRVEAGGDPDNTNFAGWNAVVIDELVLDENTNGLELDVLSVQAAGTLLANGLEAETIADCYDDGGWQDIAEVTFTEVDHGYSFSVAFNCSDDDGFPWKVELFPGTYVVQAGGDSENTNLPGWGMVVKEALKLNENTNGIELDVQSARVSGNVLANGILATPTPDCYDDGGWQDIGQVTFTEIEHGYSFSFALHCDQSAGFPWELDVFPGTYRVQAGGDATHTNLAGWNVVIHDELKVQSDMSELELDVSNAFASGNVLANGTLAAPLPDCYDDGGWQDIGQVRLVEVTYGYTFTHPLHCSDSVGFPWEIEVFPGVYRIEAGGDPANTNLPGWNQVIWERVEIP